MNPQAMPLLQVENLTVSFGTHDGRVQAVNGLSFEVAAGQALGLVGESGSGKSQTALAIMGLLTHNASVSGSVQFGGEDLLKLKPRQLNRIRGRQIGMIFQDPMTSLNPHLKLGVQMAEGLVHHHGMSQRQALQECAQMLDRVHIGGARQRLNQYAHEFSGGQRQRLMLAMTLLCRPQLLIADEPTTALDVTVQAQILDLLDELRRELNLAVLLITHDLGIVTEFCDQTLVLYGGQMMEYGPSSELLRFPTHPYTRGLLLSRPGLDTPRQQALDSIPGQPPDPAHLGAGCPFEPRCTQSLPECSAHKPEVRQHGDIRRACHGQLA